MKILVCISKAPDTTTKISFVDNDTKFNEEKVQYIVNPYDEWYALVRGLELKEAHGGSVTIITVGGAADDAIIRKALAIGADEAVRVDAQPTDAFFTANQIASYAKEGGFDLVLLGKETIDYNGSQVGGMVAELIDAPFISLATSLDVNGSTATATRDISGGEEVIEFQLPAVLSAAKGMAEQRIPNMKGIMAARKKPLNVIPAYAGDALTEISKYTLPPAKGDCKYVDADNMDELINLLHNEAKVL